MIAGVVLRNWDAFVNNQPTKTPAAKALPTASPLASAKSSPSTQLNRTDQPLAVSPQTAQLSRLRANQAALDQAKRLLRPNQASLFNKAIIEAGKVKPGDPLYKQAQQDIKRWSEVILDLAEGRAEKGNFGAAIAAAQLVPKDSSSVYTKAQQTINQWKLLSTQQQQNQNIIATAKKQIQPNQASSYNRAIRTLRQVPPDQPGYAEAQQLITQNSQAIYQLAQTRASQGKFKEAIQTATLIPAGAPAYEASQKAIAMWKQGKR
jgi:hypothetical protein